MALTNKILYDISTSAEWEARGQSDYNDRDWYKRNARENIGAYKDKTGEGGIPEEDLSQDVQDILDGSVQTIYANEDVLTTVDHEVVIPQATSAAWGVVQTTDSVIADSDVVPTSQAVKDEIDRLSARAIFIPENSWDEYKREHPVGDPAHVYYVGPKASGRDKYDVYEWNTTTSEYVLTDESSISLDGYWHNGPTTSGNGNVVSSITLGNDGIPVVHKDVTAVVPSDLDAYYTKTESDARFLLVSKIGSDTYTWPGA